MARYDTKRVAGDWQVWAVVPGGSCRICSCGSSEQARRDASDIAISLGFLDQIRSGVLGQSVTHDTPLFAIAKITTTAQA